MSYYPYGEEKTNTANDREKFGTYMRDSVTQDYADQRYYGVGMGRFNSSDPYRASAGRGDPSSWNRYTYVQSDPVNFYDPRGLEVYNPSYCPPDEENCEGPDGQPGDAAGGGGSWGPCDPLWSQQFGEAPDAACYATEEEPLPATRKPTPPPCPPQYRAYIDAYGAAALGAKLPEANALALTSIESQWGDGRFARDGNDFFNLEAFWKPGTPQPANKFAFQVGWMRATEMIQSGPLKGYYALVATYSSASDSFKSAAAQFSNLTATAPATFAKNAVADGIYAGRSPAFLTRERIFAKCLGGN
jgi:RHS repeat-associated protein